MIKDRIIVSELQGFGPALAYAAGLGLLLSRL